MGAPHELMHWRKTRLPISAPKRNFHLDPDSTQATVIRHFLKSPHWLPEAFGNPNFADANHQFTTVIACKNTTASLSP